MSVGDSFAATLAGLRANDAMAAGQIWDRFVNRLIALARVRLDGMLKAKVDPEDVAHSALGSFFLRQREGRFELGSWDDLWSLLAVITLRKCGRTARRFRGPRRDVRRETAGAEGELGTEVADPEPTPEEAVELTDTVQRLAAGLSDLDRAVLELRLQGYRVPEISDRLERTEYTIEGRLRKIRRRLRDMLPPDELPAGEP